MTKFSAPRLWFVLFALQRSQFEKSQSFGFFRQRQKKRYIFFPLLFPSNRKIYTKGLRRVHPRGQWGEKSAKNAAATYLCFCFRTELFSTRVIQRRSSESARRRRVKGRLYRKQLGKDKGPHLIEASPRTTRWLTGAVAGGRPRPKKSETRSMPCAVGNDLWTIQVRHRAPVRAQRTVGRGRLGPWALADADAGSFSLIKWTFHRSDQGLALMGGDNSITYVVIKRRSPRWT